MKKVKRILSVVLCLAMVLCAVPVGNIGMTASAISRSDFDAKLAEVQTLYPQGSQRTSWPKGSTCHGYARWISEYVWGYDFANGRGTGWTQIKATSSYSYVESIRPGDVIRFRRAGREWNHTIFITDVSESTLIYTDCNSDGHSTIKWNQTMSKSAMDTALKLELYDSRNETATYGYISQYQDVVENTSTPDTSHNPIGVVDLCNGGNGCISVRGWAFDPDDINAQLNIHVYIGAISIAEGGIGYSILANQERMDVNSVYGCGSFHGYSETIYTSLTGTQNIFIFAINTGDGENKLIGQQTVEIGDLPQPTISSTYIGTQSSDGFQLCISLSGIVDHVTAAVWSNQNQDDMQWYDCENNGYGTYNCFVKYSKHREGANYFNCHFYVHQPNGTSFLASAIDYNLQTPIVDNTYIGTVSEDSFQICMSLNGIVDHVTAAVWSNQNQDDMQWYDCENNGYGTYNCFVKYSKHREGANYFICHFYVYQPNGASFLASAIDYSKPCQHTWNTGAITQTPTCSATGTKTYTCTACNATKTETVAIDSTNHVNTTNVAATASTCTVKGYTAGVYCNDCKKYISGHTEQAINSNNHVNTTNVAATASTCTAKGYSAGVYCNDCKKYISGHQEQPLAAHQTETRNARAATCSAEGYTGDQYCTVCKQTISTGTTIGKTAHTLTTINQKNANCTEKGYTGDQYCTTCKQTITKGSETNALGHTAPDGNGNCTRCGTHIKDVTPTQPSQPQTNPNACKWCGKVHNGNFFDRIVGFFHSILAIFKR